MHVFLLNWRDIRHPRMGGAEVLTHGIFARLVARGHRVTWFSSRFPGAARTERIDGIEIIRGGNAVTVRAHAYRHYAQLDDVDLVVDEINTLPFFAPLYARVPVVALICQLARDVWFYEAPAGIAQIGYATEPLYLRPYRTVRALTISDSTARSLRVEMRLHGEIAVMPMAIDQYETSPPLPLEERDNTIVAFGRITPSKRIDQQLRALSLLVEPPFDRLRLAVVGTGTHKRITSLKRLAEELCVLHRVDWPGFVDEVEKRRILSRAKALVMSSVREGWGLAVTEANLAGTPAVGYGILGLRDSIKNGVTGLTTEESPHALAQGLRELLSDSGRYSRLAHAAQADAKTLTWDATTTYVERFLQLALAAQEHSGTHTERNGRS
ncbi:MAG TPA: glycosyltransferase family 4 protein [Candidatus Acidoferrales bacterium]|nr:glycosyltransferase family 4 protein [Candidatus Acidoferrales bacterium]